MIIILSLAIFGQFNSSPFGNLLNYQSRYINKIDVNSGLEDFMGDMLDNQAQIKQNIKTPTKKAANRRINQRQNKQRKTQTQEKPKE